jgi:hypothetical protein
MDLQAVGWKGMDRIALVHERNRWQALLSNYSEKPSGSIKYGEFSDTLTTC